MYGEVILVKFREVVHFYINPLLLTVEKIDYLTRLFSSFSTVKNRHKQNN
jgi:hypothetical protein